MELQTPPQPRVLTGNKKCLMWAVGDPDAEHSETWVVKAHTNARGQASVYIGTRRQMGLVKLSIHERCWQFAFTSEAISRLPPGTDRRLATFKPPDEIARGWRRAAVILTPTTTLSKPYAGVPVGPSRDVQWWPAPPPYQHLQFHVVIGEPNADRKVVVNDAVGPVGFIRSGLDRVVGVIATVIPLTAAELGMIAAERARAADDLMEDPVSTVSWGVCVDDGTPLLIDIACA